MGDFCRFFHIRTIPRKALPHSPYKRSVCLASALSLALHQHPCLACPSRCTEYCHPHNHCKRTIIPLPCTITLASPPLPKYHHNYPNRIQRNLLLSGGGLFACYTIFISSSDCFLANLIQKRTPTVSDRCPLILIITLTASS